LVLVCAGILAVFHLTALARLWYWYYTWIDLFPHGLAGVMVGSSILFAVQYLRDVSQGRVSLSPLLSVLVGIAIVGIGWEIFEVKAGIPIYDNYVLDTATDLCMDLIGALVAYGFARMSGFFENEITDTAL